MPVTREPSDLRSVVGVLSMRDVLNYCLREHGRPQSAPERDYREADLCYGATGQKHGAADDARPYNLPMRGVG